MFNSYKQGGMQPQGNSYFNPQQQQQQQQQQQLNNGAYNNFNSGSQPQLQNQQSFDNNMFQQPQQPQQQSQFGNGLMSSGTPSNNYMQVPGVQQQASSMSSLQQQQLGGFSYNFQNQPMQQVTNPKMSQHFNQVGSTPLNLALSASQNENMNMGFNTPVQDFQSQSQAPLQGQMTNATSATMPNGIQSMNQPQPLQPLQPQSTGMFQQPLQPQSTGMFQQPLQSQGTGMFQQPLQSQGTGMFQQSPMPTQPLQPQQTGFYVQQNAAPLEPLRPTATGFVNSFANNGINNDLNIPAVRLSFITAQDQAKFETLFRSQVPKGSNTISGEKCRNILTKSGLEPSKLARIWTLADTNKAGELLFPEFTLAMYLVNQVLKGDSIPYELSSKTKNEVEHFIDVINSHIVNTNDKQSTPFDNLMGLSQNFQLQPQSTGMIPPTSFGMPMQVTGGTLQPQSTGFMPQTSFGMPMQATGGALQPQLTGFMPHTSFGAPLQNQVTGGFTSNMGTRQIQPQTTGSMVPGISQNTTGNFGAVGQPFLQSQPTGFLPPSNFQATLPLTAQKTGMGNNEIYTHSNFINNLNQPEQETITPEEKSLFYKIFETYDVQKKGLLDAPTAVEIFRKSGLNRSDLEQIWNLCDINNSGQLNKQEFALGMHLVYNKLNGKVIPNSLPPSLVPSSNKILDNVKNQLKTAPGASNKNSTSGINGLSYKNNDEENSLPSFRNRRKTFNAVTPAVEQNNAEAQTAPTDQNSAKLPTANTSDDKATKLQHLIRERRSQLEIEISKSRQLLNQSSQSQQSDLRIIQSLQNKIRDIPAIVESINSDTPADINERIDMILTKLPVLFDQISEIENSISSAKISLYNIQNPSVIVASGKNGEITEEDRKKAKSKALLKSRMASLTGKGADVSPSIEEEESRYNEAISNIRAENVKNKNIISDIRRSISEIFSSMMSTVSGGTIGASPAQFERWEFGVGLESEVTNFIKELKNKTQVNSTELNSSKEDTSYLQEQANKKMEQKLAELRLSQPGSNIQNFVKDHSNMTISQNDTASPFNKSEEESDDEEEKRLQQELDSLKEQKKYEKEKKLAQLRQQLKEERESENVNVSVDETPISAVSVPTYNSPQPIQDTLATHQQNISQQTAEPKKQYFKSEKTESSQFDANAAEVQRRLQRGLDDDDDGWSDDENAAKAAAPVVPAPVAPTIPNQLNVEVPVSIAPPPPSISTETSAPIPVAPPIPNQSNVEVPVAMIPPPPSISTEKSAPIPIAPPLPQVSVSLPDVIAAPPPLPNINGGESAMDSDHDDVLSIPESVESNDANFE
ncbi:hypothetical protein TPHA_0I02170 [Tetrapisispora phaffii CBS 4417]|uniref:Actin cytoskeleton-regulatory complex protein PAN1 n=1 Tax=Tetrapisispora phaffii (strain ATCC 24235 / CBS 4417 / NBRC 1672 / NRRL Y-8282 / UCD 70-5) TaxID=1071381 RepID=G8BXU3_TETPH|nr:hypothetical protein TPHA_0I02170 [Tetrapisispora phaffii CBS 4417]CCE64721.1 hypothetical protein TPHA_0I02170 [Tetrapisispora phaffii CBS 4417]